MKITGFFTTLRSSSLISQCKERIRELLWSTPELLDPARLQAALLRLVLLRVFILTLLLVSAAAALFFPETQHWASSQLFQLIWGFLAVSLINVWALKRGEKLRLIGYLQFSVDVLLTSVVIYITGSASGIFLYFLVILGAAALFGGHGAVITAATCGLCYAVLASGLFDAATGASLKTSAIDIFGVYVALVGVALVGAYLAKQLENLVLIADQHARSLDELSKKQQQLFDDISEGIITLDLNSTITGINQAARAIIRLSNVDADKLIGATLPSLLRRFGMPGGKDLLGREFAPNEHSEITLCDKLSGDDIHISYAVRQVTDGQGREAGRVLIFKDVSHVRSIEERLSLHEQMAKLLSDRNDQDEDGSLGKSHGEQMIGESTMMRQVMQLVERIAGSDASVLISGESGTGKELIARAIHARGPRTTAPFVAVNCGAIPENLIESELFGHKKGSFTGAVADSLGLFRQANLGTIFLDEIGELPLHLQSKMLRVLQDKRVRPVGEVRDFAVDVRVLAASNRDLRKEVQAGRFREDLYYRLNVVNIMMPPLRDRREDVPLLIRYFIGRFCDPDRVLPQISPEALQLLMSYAFPGNVRELENIIERALVLGGSAILPGHLPEEVINHAKRSSSTPGLIQSGSAETQIIFLPINLDEELSKIERHYLVQALEKAGGIKKDAAQLLGLNFRSMRYRLKKYGLGGESEDGAAEEG